LFAVFQSADYLSNAGQLVINIPALVIADHAATGALANIYLIDEITCIHNLSLCEKLFGHNTLNSRINVGSAWIATDFAGHIEPSGIGAGNRKGEKCGEKKQAKSCCKPKRDTGGVAPDRAISFFGDQSRPDETLYFYI